MQIIQKLEICEIGSNWESIRKPEAQQSHLFQLHHRRHLNTNRCQDYFYMLYFSCQYYTSFLMNVSQQNVSGQSWLIIFMLHNDTARICNMRPVLTTNHSLLTFSLCVYHVLNRLYSQGKYGQAGLNETVLNLLLLILRIVQNLIKLGR